MANPLSSIDGDVNWNGTQVEHASGWTVNDSNNAQTFATNKTAGKVNRRPGNIDFTGSFTVKGNDANNAFYAGQVAPLKLYHSATKFWHFQDAIITGSQKVVNTETGELVGFTYNWAFAGKDDGIGGVITAPDGTVINKTLLGFGT